MTRARFVSALRWALRLLAMSALVLLVFAGKTWLAGSAALADAERAFDRGELRESVRQARRAASLYVPFAPHVEAAYDRLLIIARGAEAQRQLRLAAFAWGAMRSAAIESDSPLLGARPQLELADRNLARIAARLGTTEEGADEAAAERAVARALARPASAPAGAFLLAAAGLALAALGLAICGFWGLAANGALLRRPLVTGASLVVIGVACWTLALYRA